jgi:hypothetical protein
MVSLSYNPGHRPPLTALGYLTRGDTNADAVITELNMWLAPASKPFVLVFPDGFRMSDAAVSKKLILEHGPSIGAPLANQASTGRLAFKPSHGGWVEFIFHADDLIYMRICAESALPHKNAALSFEAPGGEVLSWPVRQSDMSRLFGDPITVHRDFLVASLGC